MCLYFCTNAGATQSLMVRLRTDDDSMTADLMSFTLNAANFDVMQLLEAVPLTANNLQVTVEGII